MQKFAKNHIKTSKNRKFFEKIKEICMYTKNEKAIIWIDMFDFLTTKKKQEILDLFTEPKDIFEDFKGAFSMLQNIISKEQFDKMCYALDEQYLNNHIVSLDSQNIKIVTFLSDDYPEQFWNFEEKPIIFYCKGDLSLLKSICVAVVGTRKPTIYGKQVTEKLVKEIASSGVTIVSGLADGIDTIAHSSALAVGGKTIAVMGSGFNDIYPKRNFELEKQIEELGLVITEYAPNIGPATWHYPVRNRIIAGLSKAVLITEASLKSGTMHTRDYALEYGIDIFAVPGEITSFASSGTNNLIKSCQSAMVTCADDILNGLNVKNTYKPVTNNIQLSLEQQSVLNAIDGETHFDEIQLKTKIDTKMLLTLLTTMELSGIIKKMNGNYYCKN